MRMSYILAAAILTATPAAFALDGGAGLGGTGVGSHITTGLNRATDTFNTPLGFSATTYMGGHAVAMSTKPSTNPTYSGSADAMTSVPDTRGGKGFNSDANSAGRNDPMPILGGRQSSSTIGGLGE